MSYSKKYYYLKLKDNFFDTEEIILLEKMTNGYKYSNILLKLYLKSLKTDGRLMFKGRIPYNEEMIAVITNHDVDIVRQALKVFKEFGLIEILDNGAIYMLDIQNFIGESSTEADRKRLAYNKMKQEQKLLSGDLSEISPPEIKKELEIEIKKDIDNSEQVGTPTRQIFKKPTLEEVKSYCIERKNSVDAQRFIDFYESKGWMVGKNKMKDWKASVRTWENKDKSKVVVGSQAQFTEKEISKYANR